jgi:uncharacterized membrane protein YkoI
LHEKLGECGVGTLLFPHLEGFIDEGLKNIWIMESVMKKQACTAILAIGLASLWLLSSAGLAATETLKDKGNPLAAEAKITRGEAEQTALKRVPNGTIKEGELEKEKGRLIWSFDIATSGTQVITEIQVDAKSGKVVSKTTETPAKEAHEAVIEAKEAAASSTPAAKAKLSQSEAEKIALTKAPNGKVKLSELETIKGRLLWDVDMTVPGTKDITAVEVDAQTGKILSTAIETPQDQANEAAMEKKDSATTK